MAVLIVRSVPTAVVEVDSAVMTAEVEIGGAEEEAGEDGVETLMVGHHVEALHHHRMFRRTI